MGKSSGWFRRIFGGKKSANSPSGSGRSDTNSSKEKKKWGFNKSHNTADNTAAPQFAANKGEVSSSSYVGGTIDANKHAIAVAAATAAVAEAAVAAARAAAEVVRLTSGGGRSTPTAYVSESRRYRELLLAAVKIQSAFRGYLAKRALKALKGLVKLQALVRGHIVRKQTADMLRRMQALVRVQARARSNRALMSEYSYGSNKSFLFNHPDPASPDKYKHQLRANSTKFDQSSILKRCGSNSNIRDTGLDKAYLGSNWLDRWMEEHSWNNHRDRSVKTYADDEKFDKILEVDTWKPHLNSKGSNRTFQTSQHVDYNNQSYMTFDSLSKYTTKAQKSIPTSGEVSLKFPVEVNEPTLWTAENSPQMFSASSMPGISARRGPFTPTRSEFSRSFYSGYSDHPNYMANTESYRAKVRSQSAPKQRIEFEKSFSTRSVHEFPDAGTNSHRRSALHGLSSLR